jgi:hypothetical protein
MSGKMKYGPRHKQSVVQAGYKYNELADLQDRKLRMHLAFIQECQKMQPQYKQELRQHKAATTNRKNRAGRAPGPEREESEQRMAEAVRKCVEILEFHMEDLVQHRKMAGRPHYVAQMQIHNVIYELRCKCGVSFDAINPQYAERQCEDVRRRDAREWKDDLLNEREQQRQSRLRNMKAIAERLIARAKTQKG